MKPHKWAKEIKAWADGAEIEYNLCKKKFKQDTDWAVMPDSEYGCIKMFDDPDLLFRISHRPKEPQYLYVYCGHGKQQITRNKEAGILCRINEKMEIIPYVGKIRLEVDDDHL